MNYIIDFKNNVSKGQILEYLSNNNFTILKEFNHFELVFLVSGNNPPPESELIESVVEDNDNGINLLDTSIDITMLSSESYEISLNEDKNWWKIASMKEVDFDQETNTIKRYGSDVTVYLLDSGVNLNHSEFSNGRVQNLFSFNNDFTDTKGHGTALASVITGETCGLSISTVKSVKIFDTNTITKQSDLLSAFDAVAVDYFQNGEKYSIVNLSWTIAKNSYIESKIDYLISLGLVVICAAGNSGVPISDVTPTSMPYVISVGAYNQNFIPCNFSNYVGNSTISVTENQVNYSDKSVNFFGWAPGEMIYSAKLDGTFGYAAGTSVSCAIASAVLANNSNLKTDHIKDENLLQKFDTKIELRRYNQTLFEYMNIFSRKDILELPSEYLSVYNTIATLSFALPLPKIDSTLNEIRYSTAYGFAFKILLMDLEKFNQVSYTDLNNIHPSFKITNGHLYGMINNDLNLLVQKFTVPLKISKDGQDEQDLTVTIIVGKSFEDIKNSNIAASSIDPDMTTLQLMDDGGCCVWLSYYCTDYSLDSCINGCLQSYFECGGQLDLALTGCYGSSKADCCCVCVQENITPIPCPARPYNCICPIE